MNEILPNLYNIKVPLPRNPLHFINSYIIKAKDRSLIIDTGMNLKECEDAIRAGLSELGIDLRRALVFVTHFHRDHIGLVPHLASDTLTVYFNKIEADIVQEYISEGDGRYWWGRHVDFLRTRGFPEEELQNVVETDRDRGYQLKGRLDLRIVKEGDYLESGDYSFRCVETPGHSPGHMCLYEPREKILISGDHILGDITPIIALWSDEMNPLKDYLASLNKIRNLDVEYVLPGHGNTFTNFKARIEELKQHHKTRTSEVLQILRRGAQNAYQIASQMTWDVTEPWNRLPSSQRWFACGEALAHLKYLEEKGKVLRHIQNQMILFSLK
jgi:glyoxylase-like metal-dependent hydrolase (beta-lactamase superfamily II)